MSCVPRHEIFGNLVPWDPGHIVIPTFGMINQNPGMIGLYHPYHPRTRDMPANGPQAESTGWIRPSEPRVIDAPLLAAMSDAMPPALFARLLDAPPLAGVPTLDLTVHFHETFVLFS